MAGKGRRSHGVTVLEQEIIYSMEKNCRLAELDMARLQEALERERHRRKMTRTAQAAELGIDAATVRQWRRGFGMNGNTALRIALLLRVDLRDFALYPPDHETQVKAA